MKVILRKEDSTTSVLLFVYNMVYSKMGSDSISLCSLLEILSAFHKSETAARMALSRACKSGLLETGKREKGVAYILTPSAKDAIRTWNDGAMRFWKRFAMRQQPWDGQWRSVTIFPEDAQIKAETVEAMRELGFAHIGGTQMLGPYPCEEEAGAILSRLGLQASSVTVIGALQTGGGVDGFLESAFNLSRLRPLYAGFMEKYGALLKQAGEEPTAGAFLGEGNALPLLHQLGYDFFRIASDDAMLPKELCPDWEGVWAAVLMRDLRGILDDASWRYLENKILHK